MDLTQRVTVVGVRIGHASLTLLRHSDKALTMPSPTATPMLTPVGVAASPPDLQLPPASPDGGSALSDAGSSVMQVPVANMGVVSVNMTPAPRKR